MGFQGDNAQIDPKVDNFLMSRVDDIEGSIAEFRKKWISSSSKFGW